MQPKMIQVKGWDMGLVPGCIFLFTSSVITSPPGRMDCRRWLIQTGIELCSNDTNSRGATNNNRTTRAHMKTGRISFCVHLICNRIAKDSFMQSKQAFYNEQCRTSETHYQKIYPILIFFFKR